MTNQLSKNSFQKKHFPALRQGDVIYFDNAATTQQPISVIETVSDYHHSSTANPGRGSYEWAMEADEIVNNTRQKVATFIGAKQENDIVFTSGTTMGLNMVAECWGRQNLKEGDEILICGADHHSMTLPWKKLADEIGVCLKYYNLNSNGSIDFIDLQLNISDRTRLCCVTHINNTVGWLNDLGAIRKILPEYVMLNVDAAQSISHVSLDVSDTKIDFLSFSGHKMFAQTGIGVFYVSPRAQDACNPFLYGGSMSEAAQGDPFYKKMEAGTLNMSGIVSLSAAINILHSFPTLYLGELTQHLYQRLLENPRIDLLYEQKSYDLKNLSAIATFTIEGWDSGELGDVLASHNIYVRTGRHCTGTQDSVRISLHIYNTLEEVNLTCDLLNELSETYI